MPSSRVSTWCNFAGHSLRAGFTTSAAEGDAAVLRIADQSRHRSLDVLRGYVWRADMFGDHAVAAFLRWTRSTSDDTISTATGTTPSARRRPFDAIVHERALSGSGWTDDPEAARQKAISLARRAVRNAGDDAGTLGRAAYVLAYFGENIDAATALTDRALQINPSFADGWWWSGWIRLWAGLPDVAIDHFEKSSRLNPRPSLSGTLMGTGVAHFFARRLEQARTMLSLSLQQHPNWVPTNRFLAACYAAGDG